MTQVALSKTKIETKIALMREALSELQLLAKLPKNEFVNKTANYAMADFFLRRALEAMLDISGHIVSRFPYAPGKRPSTYKDSVITLGQKKIVSSGLAKILANMAGFRNRMIHFYDEVKPREIYQILTRDSGDFDRFIKAIVKLVENPSKFDLTVED